MQIILASASPRRKELLEKTGLRFEVDPSDYPEDLSPNLDPHELAKRLSLEKAKAVAPRHPHSIVIAADTFGVLDSRILGKPSTQDEAREMLAALSGRAHRVITGFTIMETDSSRTLSRTVVSWVYFRRLTPEQIDDYVASGEPMGKAAAYAIQGRGASLIEKVDGDYSNVVGLPVEAVLEALGEFGVKPDPDVSVSGETERR